MCQPFWRGEIKTTIVKEKLKESSISSKHRRVKYQRLKFCRKISFHIRWFAFKPSVQKNFTPMVHYTHRSKIKPMVQYKHWTKENFFCLSKDFLPSRSNFETNMLFKPWVQNFFKPMVQHNHRSKIFSNR